MKILVAVLIVAIIAAAASVTTAIALSAPDSPESEATAPRILRPSTRTPVEQAIYDYDQRRQSQEAERDYWHRYD